MSLFEFILVAVSIVLGVAVSTVLLGIVAIVQRWRERPLFWVHGFWISFVLLGLARAWWQLWQLRDHAVWTFPEFLLLTAQIGVLFISSAFIAPTDGGALYDDGRSFYYGIKREFFSWRLAHIALSVPYFWFHLSIAEPGLRFIVPAITVGLYGPPTVIALRSESDRTHAVVAVFLALVWFLIVFGETRGASPIQ